MRPRGLYVVDSKKLYIGDSVVYAKLSTIHNAINDKLIEKAKKVAKGCQLDKFAIIYVNADAVVQLLYMND